MQLKQTNMYKQLSKIKENEPNAYEVPVSSKNRKEEWTGDMNLRSQNTNESKLIICF